MKRVFKKAFTGIALAFALLIAGIVPAATPKKQAAAEERAASATSVKVGYYIEDKFQMMSSNADHRRSGYAYEYYQQISLLANWVYSYVTCTDATDALTKLKAGAVDIVAGVNETTEGYDATVLSLSEQFMGYKTITEEMNGRYFAVRTDSGLKATLDGAMTAVLKNPTYIMSQYQGYYFGVAEEGLTAAEISWLAAKKTLKIGYVNDNLPISDTDSEGNATGLIKELVSALTAYLEVVPEGVTVQPVGYNSVDDLENALKEKFIDIIFPIYADYWLSEEKGFNQSNPIFTDNIMMIFRAGDGLTVQKRLESIGSCPRAVGQKMYVQNLYPEIDSSIEYYRTTEAAVVALKEKKSDCILAYASSLQRTWTLLESRDGLANVMLDKSAEFALATHNSDATLVNILNKYLAGINDADITNSLAKYSIIEVEKTYTFGDFMRNNIFAVVGILIAIFAVIAGAFTYYVITLRKSRATVQKALKAAERANKSKTDFLSSMSHDIRTPMNAIVGMTSIATKHMDDKERVKSCLDKITLSSNHLLTLINDVLDISKIESGKLALHPINFSLRDTLTGLTNIVRPMINEKRQHFDVHVRNVKYETVYADSVRVNQIFINILSNAVKYTPEGGRVAMDIAQEVLPDGDHVRIIYTVEDNGIGMSKEYMETMFEAFSRSEDSRTSKIQGTGLGLAIVKQMVTLMNGTIECESEIDKGTKFTVTLDLPIGEKDEKKVTLPGVKLLVVDDDPVFLDCVEDIILDMEAEIDTVESGEAAIRVLQRDKKDYSVIIVDWRMPGMSGRDTVRAIRKITEYKTPVILVSAYDIDEIEDEIDDDEVDGFISKPLFRSYIYEKLCTVLHLNEHSEEKKEAVDAKLGKLNILVAEDNDLNWEVISELLEIHGIKTKRAENGKICVDMIHSAPKGKYDLILMDVQMPVMDGRQATREIRKSELDYVREIPIVAMTADAFAEDIAACIDAGMNEHVSKPVDMEKLLQTIRKIMYEKKA